MTNTEIISVVEQLIEAENAANADAAGRLLAPDFTAITRARGVEQDRAQLLKELASPASSLMRRLEGEPSVRQSADLAVVRTVVVVTDGSSPPGVSRFRNTHILTRQADAWRCVAWQVTELT